MTTFTDQNSRKEYSKYSQNQTDDPKHDGLTTPENKRIPVPHVEPEPGKEAFGAAFLDPMINLTK
jgi:hypothetical protein